MSRNKLVNSLLVLASLMILLALGEGICRIRFDVIDGGFRRFKYPDWVEQDAEAVWRPAANLDSNYLELNSDGKIYPVHFTTQQSGFRMRGVLQSNLKKVLVVGDSFTLARQVSDDKTYYHRLRDTLGVEMFVIAADGYNSVQEMIMLKRYLKEVDPDLILWQFASNDLINNSPLNRRIIQFVHTPVIMQPFWSGSVITYAGPDSFMEWLLTTIRSTRSRLLYFLTTRTLSLYMGQKVKGFEFFKMSAKETEPGKEATLNIFREVKKIIGSKPLVLFSSADARPPVEVIRRIADDNGFIFIDKVRDALDHENAAGRPVFVNDSIHWNEHGHEVVASRIAAEFKTNETLRSLLNAKAHS